MLSCVGKPKTGRKAPSGKEFIIMKKILALTVALLMTSAMFTGCGDSDSSSEAESGAQSQASGNSAAESKADSQAEASGEELAAPVNDGPVDINAGCTENMLIRSVLNEGDTTRLASKIKYALDNPKETTKITFMGDSITAGSAASSSSNQYVSQFQTWWEENVSFYVDVTNAGIGATDSYLGVHRVQTDVLDAQPDIIFIEFINDADNDFYKSTMDSLIRKCMSAENKPAVVLVEMTMEDGTCPQRVHSEIAKGYDLPIISYHDAMLPEVNAGNIKWSDISPDNIHPNDQGHVMLGQMLTSFVSKVKDNAASAGEPADFTAESPTGDKYANASIADKTTGNVTVVDEGKFTDTTSPWNFANGWATNDGGSITFEMEFKNLGMLYYKTTGGMTGAATITIDGEEIGQLDGDFTGGWGDYATNSELYTSDETAKHTVTVTVNEGDKKHFEVLGWLIS